MNFCSRCGHKVVFKEVPGDHLPRHFCENCDTIHYKNPRVITGCLPIWGEQVLLAKRDIEPRRHRWNIPSGFMENDETAEAGAAREVYEESLATVEILNVHAIFSIPRVNQVYIHFLGNLKALDFGATPESSEVRLFHEEEIPWDELAFTSWLFSLKRFFEDRRNGKRDTHLGSDENNFLTK